jgi:hypothetical protein
VCLLRGTVCVFILYIIENIFRLRCCSNKITCSGSRTCSATNYIMWQLSNPYFPLNCYTSNSSSDVMFEVNSLHSAVVCSEMKQNETAVRPVGRTSGLTRSLLHPLCANNQPLCNCCVPERSVAHCAHCGSLSVQLRKSIASSFSLAECLQFLTSEHSGLHLRVRNAVRLNLKEHLGCTAWHFGTLM